jgi:hypothetical protein
MATLDSRMCMLLFVATRAIVEASHDEFDIISMLSPVTTHSWSPSLMLVGITTKIAIGRIEWPSDK